MPSIYKFFFLILGFSFAIAGEEPKTIQDLKELVEINSGTKNVEGVNKVQDWLANQLIEMGFEVEKINSPQNPKSSGYLLRAKKLPSANATKSKFITFLVHADTVFELDSPFQKFEKVNEEFYQGPGIIDAKGGMIVLLEVLRKLDVKAPDTNLAIQVLSSPVEETGSGDFLEIFRSVGEESKMILGFEPGLEGGNIIETRRGNRWYKIQVEGKEAHSGRALSSGVNACWDLSIRLKAIMDLNKKLPALKSGESSISIGHFSGGKEKFNIVCGSAEAWLDVRFSSQKQRASLVHEIEKILAMKTQVSTPDKELPRIQFTITDDTPSLSATPKTKNVLKRLLFFLNPSPKDDLKTADKNSEIKSSKSLGTADINLFGDLPLDLILIDGLGPYGSGMHTPKETLYFPSIESRAAALARFLKEEGNLSTNSGSSK